MFSITVLAMKVKTLEDWNTLITQCNCYCGMPVCPYPELEYESIGGSSRVAGVNQTGSVGSNVIYRKARHDYSNGGFSQTYAPDTHWTSLGGVEITPPYVEHTSGEPRTGTVTTTYSITNDPNKSRKDGFEAIKAHRLDWDNMTKGGGPAGPRSRTRFFTPTALGTSYTLEVYFRRYRWIIPQSHEGSYFKIKWNVIESLDGKDGEPHASRKLVEIDKTWTWKGPGDPDDAESWASPWYELLPPDFPGVRYVSDVRFECYRSSRVGHREQIHDFYYEIFAENETGQINSVRSGQAGEEGNAAPVGRYDLTTGGLKTGGLRTGNLEIGGLRTGSLRIGTLRSSRGLVFPTLSTGGLVTSGLRSSGGLRTGGLRTGGLRSSGGLRTGGLRTSRL
jgi:hypothetical protein